jgi:hypothetical protein
MIKSLRCIFLALLVCLSASAQVSVTKMSAASMSLNTINSDVCIYGGTSAGVMAAIAVARMGYHPVIVCPYNYLGGMTSGGLGATDLGVNGIASAQGLALEFYNNIGYYYYGFKTPVYNFEPHVALAVFNSMVKAANIPVFYNCPIQSVTTNSTGTNWSITSITCTNGLVFTAKIFNDESYEGDLMSRAGVSYVFGREATNTYGEIYNGVRTPNNTTTGGNQFGTIQVNPYVVTNNTNSGYLPLISTNVVGTLGSADSNLPSYNYRLCWTTLASDQIAFSTNPPGYNATNYELVGRFCAANVASNVTLTASNFFYFQPEQNSKVDINNNGAISTDDIGANQTYLTNTYAGRNTIALAHQNYILGLIAFLFTDSRVPTNVVNNLNQYGWAADEFTNNSYFPPALYVREARRMVGEGVGIQSNVLSQITVSDSIGLGNYTMDSHNVQRVVQYVGTNAWTYNEGDVEVINATPFPISYSWICPKTNQCSNLHVSWALSASHIAMCSLRTEITGMGIGQAAGIASVLAIQNNCPVQNIPIATLQSDITNARQYAVGAINGKISWP